MRPVDSHCHMDFEQFDGDREEVIEHVKDELLFIVNAGSNLKHNRAALKLQEKHPDFVKANLGLHPVYTESYEELEEIKEQIRENDPIAVGEIGLDHHHIEEKKMKRKQEEVFREMLELAEEMNRPVVVHTRDAERKSIEVLKEYSLPGVLLHCFNGKPELAEESVDKGMKIGVTTQVLYSNRVQKIVRELDIDEILLETDSPYLYSGERNEPVNVLESAEKIAELKNIQRKEVVEATTSNAIDVFGDPR